MAVNQKIEIFIQDNLNESMFELSQILNREIERIDRLDYKVQNPKTFSVYETKEYRKYLMGFLYYLNTGGIPASIGIEGMGVFKPLISSLSLRGEIKEDLLNSLE